MDNKEVIQNKNKALRALGDYVNQTGDEELKRLLVEYIDADTAYLQLAKEKLDMLAGEMMKNNLIKMY